MLAKTRARLSVLSGYFALQSERDSLAEYYRLICSTRMGIFAPLQVESEFIRLLEEIRSIRPRFVIEIGTAKGGTLFMLARAAASDAHLISVDLPYGEFGGGYSPIRIPIYKSFARDQQRISLVRGNSHDPASLLQVQKHLSGEHVDLLFIDGDHTYEGVKQDFLLYSQLVRPGGMIALHDIAKHPPSHNCHVDLFWEELKRDYKTTELIEDLDQGWAGIGIVHVPFA